MFYLFSKSKVKRFLTGGFVLLAIIAIITGCNSDLEDDTNYPGVLPEGLTGKWVFNVDDYYEVIPVDGQIGTLQYTSVWDGTDYGYEGIIRFISNYSESSGIIILEFTDGAPDASKPFTGIYYQNLNASTVKLANVINLKAVAEGDYANYCVDTETLEEAITKFTRGNSGKYVDWSNVIPYTKTSS